MMEGTRMSTEGAQINTDLKHKELTDKIIGAFYKVYNTLGYGFLEKVYLNSMMIEFKKAGIQAFSQQPITILYENEIVGEYYPDIIIEKKVILELKAAQCLSPEHEAQLLNYLKAATMEVGLLLNFGPRPEIKRKVFDNSRKICVHLNESVSSVS